MKMKRVVNRFERELTQYMVHIDIAALNEHQQLQLRHLLLMVNDLEKISDRCKDLAELSELMLKENSMFSIGGYEDLQTHQRPEQRDAGGGAVLLAGSGGSTAAIGRQ